MKITMYELLGLIKDGKEPKKIKCNDIVTNQDKIYIWYDWAQGYYEENHGGEFDYKLLAYRNEQFSKILNSMVEILPEENDKWKDIEELAEYTYTENYTKESIEYNRKAINQLIKNQKYLKEKLESKE